MRGWVRGVCACVLSYGGPEGRAMRRYLRDGVDALCAMRQ